ncbi:MAG: sulfatase-like hydrolase/transferase, partial [bacterium]|nr:sulfatase-like hydrolase/transferase [bacterium]
MSRPNILFILTDQQRWDSLGCYNTPGVHTPNLDRLAEEGVRYNQCYVNSTICTPSRASLWTGKHVTGHGVHTLHDVLPQDEVLFPEHLRKAGYDTALFGKLHVAGHIFETDNRHRYDGFNHYDWCPDPRSYRGADNAYWRWLAVHHPDILDQISNSKRGIGHISKEGHMTTWAANATIDYLQSMQGTHRSFFCCMSVFDPHSPYDNYPLEYRDLIDGDALPPVFNPGEPFENRPIAHFEEHDKKGDFPSLEELKEIRIGYHAAVALIDEQVGRVLHTLAETGFADNTVVIFTSDHGDMLGDHGLTMKGAFMYDACTRVPMLVRWPNNPAGSTINA